MGFLRFQTGNLFMNDGLYLWHRRRRGRSGTVPPATWLDSKGCLCVTDTMDGRIQKARSWSRGQLRHTHHGPQRCRWSSLSTRGGGASGE